MTDRRRNDELYVI